MEIQSILDAERSHLKIISKIENQQGIDNLDEILTHSYGVMIADGLTTLAENVREPYGSLNHHFWGDISALMIEYFAGIRPNPTLQNAANIDIRPVFCSTMQHAKAYYKSISGRVEVAWERTEEGVVLTLSYPKGASGFVWAPRGYTVNGKEKVKAESGTFVFEPTK